ncbi:MAG: glucose-1-phosphate thymidylyltransferase [Firmicutes bacterium]|nr:glucose-1-phosphate thymidylyltransferase [Bacillota bacterium]
MKGLILSGGKGTRLRPITYTQAKQLIPVANKSILFYGIELLRDAGVTEIGFIVGDTADQVIEAVGDGSKFGIKATFIHQDAPLGLAHAVLTAEPFIGKDRFVMFLGDNLIKQPLGKFAEEFQDPNLNSVIMLTPVENPSSFGVAELEGNRVVKLVEKPKEPKSNLALVGIYFFDHNIFDMARQLKPSWRGELEITDAIQSLIDNGFNVHSHKITGWWKDTGKLEDLIEANRMILEDLEKNIEGSVDEKTEIQGRVKIEEGAVLENCVVRGPSIIGKNAVIRNSYIGPFSSVAPGVKIINSQIEYSIIMDDAEISDIDGRIEYSLVGRGCRIYNNTTKPKAHRLMLGENSEVGMI